MTVRAHIRKFSDRSVALAFWIALCIIGLVHAQEDGATPEAVDVGTPGLVDVADNLNLPLVPPQPGTQQDASPRAEPPILPDTPNIPLTTVPPNLFESVGDMTSNAATRLVMASAVYTIIGENDRNRSRTSVQAVSMVAFHPGASMRVAVKSSDMVYAYTNPKTGITIKVFSDATFELWNREGSGSITGYFGYIAGDRLVAIGEDLIGTRYALYGGYFSVHAVNGDVITGNRFTSYSFQFDPNGRLTKVADSDGGHYEVEVDEAGLVWIDGPDGFSVTADDTGAFELYDDAGDLVAAGDLNDADHVELPDLGRAPNASEGNDPEPLLDRTVVDDDAANEDAADSADDGQPATSDDGSDSDSGGE